MNTVKTVIATFRKNSWNFQLFIPKNPREILKGLCINTEYSWMLACRRISL